MATTSDNFDDPRGRFAAWTSLLADFTAGTDSFIGNNEHVDLRIFDSAGFFAERPISELDQLTMGDIEAVLEVDKGAVAVAFSPATVFTNTAHALTTESIVQFYPESYPTPTGSLPPGIIADRSYYVTSTPTVNTFTASATPGGKDLGSLFAIMTDYDLGDVIHESGDPTKLHLVTIAGTSGNVIDPPWNNTTVGDTTVSGGVTFTFVGLTTDQSGTHTMSAFVDDSIYDEMFELERKGQRPDEAWVTSLPPSKGGYGAGEGLKSVAVGNLPAYDNWRGLSALTDGTDPSLDVDIVSGIAVDSSITESDGLDLSDQDDLILVFPDFGSGVGEFTAANCTIQLSSHESGGFDVNTGNGDSAELSASVAFTANSSTLPELRLPLSSFTGASFDIESVTGIKIHLDGPAPSDGLDFTIMGVRAVTSSWEYRTIDFDTRRGGLTVPVTLDGLDPGASDDFIPIIRGEDLASDTRPIDSTLSFQFNTGGRTNVATGANYNKIEAIFRERRDTSGVGLSNHIVARLKWNDAGTFFETEAYEWEGPGAGTVTLSGQLSHDLSAVLENASDADQDAGNYVFKAVLLGNEFLLSLFKVDSQGAVTELVTSHAVSLKSTLYTITEGRLGLFLEFLDRDAIVDQFISSGTSFATMLTKAFPSRTPVKGVQINAEYSSDTNLFRNWNDIVPAEFFIDRSKTTSGYGSRRTESGLISNQFFVIEDWAQTYLEMDIWVGSGITENNRPIVSLNSFTETLQPILPTLQPNRWNRIEIELEQFRESATGEFYQLEIAPLLKDGKLGFFWVDAVKVGKRTIRWEARTEEENPWRELRGVTNEEWGALHFGNSERGSNLQIRATAVEQEAWVGSYRAVPSYATLGAFIP